MGFLLFRTRAVRRTSEFSRENMAKLFPQGFGRPEQPLEAVRLPVLWTEAPVQFTLKPQSYAAAQAEM
jgi:hypothetical protein